MYSLFIDTHSELITIGLINERDCFIKEKESYRSHSAYALPLINELLEERNLELKNINKIIVVNGPGSFTGIRIGLSIAKTISYALNIPVVTITSLEAFLTSDNTDGDKMCVIEDTKGYYISIMKNKNILESEYVYEIDEYKSKYKIIENKLDLRNIFDFVKNKKETNVFEVKACYIKKIEAEK